MRRTMIDVAIALAVIALVWWNAVIFRAEYHYQKGLAERGKNRSESALRQFELAAQILPQRAEYQRTLGQESFRLYRPGQGNLRLLYQAHDAYQQVLKDDPQYPYGWFEMGKVLEEFSNAKVSGLPSPDAYFQRAVLIDPTNPRFLAGRLQWELNQGKNPEQCWALFQELMKSYPQAITKFGGVMLKTDQDVIRLRQAMGSDNQANLAIAQFLFKTGRNDLAFKQLEQISGPDSQDPRAAALRAELLTAQGQTDLAKKTLREALAQHPNDLALVHPLFALLKKEGDWKAAIAVGERAFQAHPLSWDLPLANARLAREKGQMELALKFYQEALDTGKALPAYRREALLFRAEARRNKGDLGGALADYEKCLQITPDDQKIIMAIKTIGVQREYDRDREKNP